MKILIIEDDLSIAELENDYLTMSGFECDIATDGNSGLEKARSGDYALIIVDIMLPGRDGFSICKEIRAESDVPIIFLSAKSDEIDKQAGAHPAPGAKACPLYRWRIRPDPQGQKPD